jgi:hypothetical protein
VTTGAGINSMMELTSPVTGRICRALCRWAKTPLAVAGLNGGEKRRHEIAISRLALMSMPQQFGMPETLWPNLTHDAF